MNNDHHINGLNILFRRTVIVFSISLVYFIYAYFAGSNIFFSDGYFSGISNVYYSPLILSLIFFVTFLQIQFDFIISSKVKIFFALFISNFFIHGSIQRLALNDTSNAFQSLLSLPIKLEYALAIFVIVLLFGFFIFSLIYIGSTIRTLSYRSLVRPSVIITSIILVAIICAIYQLSTNSTTIIADSNSIKLPNTQTIKASNKVLTSEDRSLKYLSYRIVYPELPPGERDTMQYDTLSIFNDKISKPVPIVCVSNNYSSTSEGVEYGISEITKFSSSTKSEESKYTERDLCFVLNERMYKLTRTDAYGKTSLKTYSDEEVINSFISKDSLSINFSQ